MKVLFVSAYGKWDRPASFIESQSDSLKQSGVDLTDFYFKQRGLRGYIKYYCKLLAFLRKNKFDIIHAHYSYTALFVYFTFPKSKFIVSFMGTDLMGILKDNFKQRPKGRFNLYLSRFLQSKADHIIIKSEKMLAFIEKDYHCITSVIPNGINLMKFPIVDESSAKHQLNLDHSKKYILFLGNTRQKLKNFKLLEEAFIRLSCTKIELLCPFPINGGDVYLYLNACTVLALPSLQEGSPNVIKEALACNCPIVATNVGDVKARLSNIQGCYISNFSPEDFAFKLDAALNFGGRTNGRDSLHNLQAENISLQINKLYHSLLL